MPELMRPLAPPGSLLRALPVVDDLGFWLVINSLVLAYVGAAELLFQYGPGQVYSALAVALAAGYLVMARHWVASRLLPLLGLAMLVPSLVILGDLLVTRAQFPLSVLIDMVSLILIFVAYREYRQWRVANPFPPVRW
jgi:hypothetical protein